MNVSAVHGQLDGPSSKKARKKERWSDERKAAAKAERDIEDARREANGNVSGESKSKSKKEKKKKKDSEDLKVRKLSVEERISGPGNASEAETLRNTLGFTPGQDDTQLKELPSFEFGFGPTGKDDNQANTHVSSREKDDDSEVDVSSSSDSETSQDPQVEENRQKIEENPITGNDESIDGFVPRRIFVGGMPFSYTEGMIREYWEYCGPIETLDMMTFPDTGRFKGIAFITFATEEAFESALAYDGTDCDGQILKVQKCKADNKRRFKQQQGQTSQNVNTSVDIGSGYDVHEYQEPDAQFPLPKVRQSAQKVQGYNVAYVGNIAFAASSDDIKALFEPFGATLVRLHTDKDTGKPKGYAHVHFKDEESLDRAVQMDGTPLLGRRIKVGFAQKKKNNT